MKGRLNRTQQMFICFLLRGQVERTTLRSTLMCSDTPTIRVESTHLAPEKSGVELGFLIVLLLFYLCKISGVRFTWNLPRQL